MPGLFISDNNLPVTKVGGFTGTDTYYTGDGTGPQVNLTGFSIWLVVDPNHDQTTNEWQLLMGKTNHNNNKIGWLITQFQGEIAFTVDATSIQNDGIAANKVQNTSTSWGEYGHLQVLHGVVRNNVIYLYKNGIITGSGIAKASIVNGNPSAGIAFGAYHNIASSSYQPYEGSIIAAGIASSTGLTDSQVAAHYLALRSDVYASVTGATNLWRGTDAGATWTDTIGSLVATRSGSPTVTETYESHYRTVYDPTKTYGDTAPILPQLPNTLGSLDILCLGDSRTIGGHVSYRYICQQGKDAAGMSNLRWVGPVSNTDYGYTDAYSAYGGTDAGNHLNADVSAPNLTTLINTYDPDVCILWFGTNALDTQDQIPIKGNFTSLILAIHALKPNCRFLVLSELNALRASPILDAKEKDFSIWLMTSEVSRLKNLGIKIIACDIYNSLLWSNNGDWLDTIHPATPSPVTDIEGYNKIGQVVWPALRYVCGYN